MILEMFKNLSDQTNSKIWNRSYLLQGTSNMEPDPERIKDIHNITQIQKRNKKEARGLPM